ncbi:hypothetical protein ANCDUO_24682 [Ancylostoma duodenale]|uniref:Uncharacterized protein n=1 Tax=Ancylostoma duodenale TaxID=51022 RepID=A0A0C2FA08_9BILA|nr:hypothetical protein ANCDUO_24682 [Ancylostoma duodenale]
MGELLPRHMSVFRSNQFFFGLSIPEPEQQEPLPLRLPNATSVQLDFLYVSSPPTRLPIVNPLSFLPEMLRNESGSTVECARIATAQLLQWLAIALATG